VNEGPMDAPTKSKGDSKFYGGYAMNEFDEDTEIPTKCVKTRQAVSVNCQIQFIDFEGRSDGESIQKIIEQMKPRRLIITRGTAESCATLSKTVTRSCPESKIFIPTIGEVLDVTSESHIYQVKLRDSLMSSIVFQRGKDAEIAWVDGRVVLKGDEAQEEGEEPGTSSATPDEEVQLLVPMLEPLTGSDVIQPFIISY